MDASSLPTGQQARTASVLRETVSLMPGSIVTQEKLTAGEYALLQSGESVSYTHLRDFLQQRRIHKFTSFSRFEMGRSEAHRIEEALSLIHI